MKPIAELTKKTLATLDSLPLRIQESATPKHSSDALNARDVTIAHQEGVASAPANPCRTVWQRKWLGLDVHHPQIQVLADDVEAFCRDFLKNNRERPLLVLAGDTGSGKSRVAKRVHQWVNALGFDAFAKGWGYHTPSSLYLPWPEAVNGFKEGRYGVLDDCKTAGLAVLDDIGAEDDPWKKFMDQLCQIFTAREGQQMFTFVATNIEPNQWEEYFGRRIADRLFNNARMADLFGVPSYRVR